MVGLPGVWVCLAYWCGFLALLLGLVFGSVVYIGFAALGCCAVVSWLRGWLFTLMFCFTFSLVSWWCLVVSGYGWGLCGCLLCGVFRVGTVMQFWWGLPQGLLRVPISLVGIWWVFVGACMMALWFCCLRMWWGWWFLSDFGFWVVFGLIYV